MDLPGVILLATALALTPSGSPVADEAPQEKTATHVDDVVAHVKSLPEAELKQFYRRCTRASVRGHLGAGEIALCSVGYEQLLQRHFGGDFRAFLAWRRAPEGETAPARPSPF